MAAYHRGDYVTALRLWRPLADQGNVHAQFNLGVKYHQGQGVPQDYAQAVSWCRKAADQGMVTAQFNLGVMYEHGLGVVLRDTLASGESGERTLARDDPD